MNDSFLEDLEIVPTEQKAGSTVHHAERNITRRRSQPSPLHPSHDQGELNILMARQATRQKLTPAIAETKITHRRSADSKEIKNESRKPASREIKIENLKPIVPDRKSKLLENKLKPVENTDQIEAPKLRVDKKEQPRWSAGSSKESSRSSDGSTKENSRPCESSKESIILTETPKERPRGSGDGPNSKRKTEEKFEVAMLNSVKEIVSTYTKNESTRILRAMQEMYINSQANLIKLMLQQTDDLLAEEGKPSPRSQFLTEENKRLKEYINFLETRNDELKKSIEDHEKIKQENLQLKNRCNELLKSAAAKEINCFSDGSSKENNCPANLPKKNVSPKSKARQFLERSRNAK